MANVREIYVEVKKSKNFQTYTVGHFVTIEDGDDVEAITTTTRAKCRTHCLREIAIDQGK